MPLHATLRPVIGGLCFHLSEEIKSDARQMPNIVSTVICLLEFPLAINQFAEMFLDIFLNITHICYNNMKTLTDASLQEIVPYISWIATV